MDKTLENNVKSLLETQRSYFKTGRTKETDLRLKALRRLKESILSHSGEIEDALRDDLHKSPSESYLTETSIVLHELKTHIRNLRKWARTRRVGTPYFLWPSKSRIVKEPYGHALIISPWNYPFQLSMVPLVAAISAGNVAVVKPSHQTPKTAEVIDRIIREVFDQGHVACLRGETEMSTLLLEQRFDYIFFTGSPRVGRIVMEAAAKNLTPVTLELGGKSPCIVDRDADLKTAARRITWGKLINAGQTCIAPDYLLVHTEVEQELLELMTAQIRTFYGHDPLSNPDYPRIVSPEATQRLSSLLESGTIRYGGTTDRQARYISPTILTEVSPESPVMQQEIFGPILPVITVNSMEEAVSFVNSGEKPLALYYFGKEKNGRQIIRQTSSGGACINDTLLHIANPKLPFGGVGNSGMGSYHGRAGFDTFTHKRSVLISRNRIDVPFKFPPFKKPELLKRLM